MFKNRQKKDKAVIDESTSKVGEVQFKNKNDDPQFDEEYLKRHKKYTNENVMNPVIESVNELIQEEDDYLVKKTIKKNKLNFLIEY